jgi:hypothetical protein
MGGWRRIVLEYVFKIMKNKGFGQSRVGIYYEENQGQN